MQTFVIILPSGERLEIAAATVLENDSKTHFMFLDERLAAEHAVAWVPNTSTVIKKESLSS